MTEPTEQPTSTEDFKEEFVEIPISPRAVANPEKPKCKTCFGDGWLWTNFGKTGKHKSPCPDCQPNQNLLIVKTIQQRIHVITNELEKLPNSPSRTMALDDIGIFEAGVLYKLQEEYE